MEKIEIGEIFTISDENDEENEVEVLATFTIEEADYVAVAFADDVKEDTEEDIDIFFLKIDLLYIYSIIVNDWKKQTK